MAVSDKNLYAYCDNNPIMRVDTTGAIWETVFDVISLGASAVEVCMNPDDPWAWAGLAGDLIDLIPFVTGVGEVTRGVKVSRKVVDTLDEAADATRTLSKGGSATKDIYRAVGVDEYYDIMSTKSFRGIEGKTMAAKEFGNSFSETLDFANRSINIDKVAIIKVTIPESVYNRLNHMSLDPAIFKSGTPVVEPHMLEYFNRNIIGLEHFY